MPQADEQATLTLVSEDPRTDEAPELDEQTRAELDAYHALCDALAPRQEQP